VSWWTRIILTLLALLAALPAQADELRPGYLEFTQQDVQNWKLVWKAPVLGGLATRTRPAFPAFCTQSPPQARVEGLVLIAESRLTCRIWPDRRSVYRAWTLPLPMPCSALLR
jgi:hypothetical protein